MEDENLPEDTESIPDEPEPTYDDVYYDDRRYLQEIGYISDSYYE